MMTVRLRMAAMLARWALGDRKPKSGPAGRLEMRCWWTDCDINRHMNNSRYLALMDMGRYHFCLETGLWREFCDRKWFPMVVRAEIDFKRGIKPGEAFLLETRLERVGVKSLVMGQRYYVGDTLTADARITAVFTKGGRAQELKPLVDRWSHLLPNQVAEVPEHANAVSSG